MEINNFNDDFKEWVGDIVLTILEFTELEDLKKLSNILNQGENLKYDGKYVFKNNVINSDGFVNEYKIIGCNEWLNYYGSPCFYFTLDTEKKCVLPHLVFKNADTSGNLGFGPSDELHGSLALTPIISKNLKINRTIQFTRDNEPVYGDNLDAAISDKIKIKKFKSTEEEEIEVKKEYKPGDLHKAISEQKVFERDNLNFMNPEGAPTLIKAYLDIHFDILKRIEI